MREIKNGRYTDKNGTVSCYANGELHCENGTAFETANGDKSWLINGQFHREDGPAIERENGEKDWYINDNPLTEEEFNQWKVKKALNDKLEVKLDPKLVIKRLKI